MKTVLIDRGMISPKDIHLLQLADTPEEVGAIIEKFYTENHLSPNF
jgi:predicted Rossmann-fold nucleotide-binding protein